MKKGTMEYARAALRFTGALNGAGLTDEEMKRISDDLELAGAVAKAIHDMA